MHTFFCYWHCCCWCHCYYYNYEPSIQTFALEQITVPESLIRQSRNTTENDDRNKRCARIHTIVHPSGIPFCPTFIQRKIYIYKCAWARARMHSQTHTSDIRDWMRGKPNVRITRVQLCIHSWLTSNADTDAAVVA